MPRTVLVRVRERQRRQEPLALLLAQQRSKLDSDGNILWRSIEVRGGALDLWYSWLFCLLPSHSSESIDSRHNSAVAKRSGQRGERCRSCRLGPSRHVGLCLWKSLVRPDLFGTAGL